MKTWRYLPLCGLLWMVSCGDDAGEKGGSEKDSPEAQKADSTDRAAAFVSEITELEKDALKDQTVANKAKADQLIAQYSAFANTFPDHDMADDYLLKAASVSFAMAQFMSRDNKNDKGYCRKAVALSERLLTQYPESDQRRPAYDILTTVLDFDLEDDTRAVQFYRQYMAEFPADSAIAQTCRARIAHPELTVEDIVHGKAPAH
jgi:hypothetical protein